MHTPLKAPISWSIRRVELRCGCDAEPVSRKLQAPHMSNPPDTEPKSASDNDEQPVPQSTTKSNEIQTSDLIEGYHVIAEWIRFADAKAAVVLTVGGAVGGLVIPTLKEFLKEGNHITLWWTTMVSGLFALWLLLLLLSGIWAFLSILPFRKRGRHPALQSCKHFHPAAICTAYELDDTAEFQSDCEDIGESGLRREVAACLLIDSHISGFKYKRVTTSIRLMGASSIVALLYLIAIQF